MDLASILNFVSVHGYFFIFFTMIVEGPIVNFIASFLASQGYFNIFIIGFLAILGDLIGDLLFYFIGRIGKKKIINKQLKKENKLELKVNNLEKALKNNPLKTLLLIKVTPLITTIGLIVAGYTEISFGEYILYTGIYSITQEIIITCLGYFSGISISTFAKDLNIFYILLSISVILAILVIYSFKKINEYIKNKLAK